MSTPAPQTDPGVMAATVTAANATAANATAATAGAATASDATADAATAAAAPVTVSTATALLADADRAAVAAGPADHADRTERAERDARLARLLGAAAGGDTSAFESFYDATAGYARALARRVLAGADTDDLLADAYFEAWRTVARFDPGRGSAVTWLLTIVKSRALDLLRHRTTHPSVAGQPGDTLHDIADRAADASDPADRLWQQQAGTLLHAALGRLSATERWVLGLAYFRELTHAEIAACTGMPLGTVKSHLLRSQRKLRDALVD